MGIDSSEKDYFMRFSRGGYSSSFALRNPDQARSELEKSRKKAGEGGADGKIEIHIIKGGFSGKVVFTSEDVNAVQKYIREEIFNM